MKQKSTLQININSTDYIRLLRERIMQEMGRCGVTRAKFAGVVDAQGVASAQWDGVNDWRPTLDDIEKTTLSIWFLGLTAFAFGIELDWVFTGKRLKLDVGVCANEKVRTRFEEELKRLDECKEIVWAYLNVEDMEIEDLDVRHLAKLAFVGFDIGYIVTGMRADAVNAAEVAP